MIFVGSSLIILFIIPQFYSLNIRRMKKFNKLFEAYYGKYAAGVFSPDDVVKIDVKKLKKHDVFKELQPQLQAKLLTMAEASDSGEAVICVVARDSSPFIHDIASLDTLTLGYSLGGGRYTDIISIPGALCDCIEIVEDLIGNQISKLPPNCRIDYPVKTEPKEVDLEELEKHRFDSVASSIFDTVAQDLHLTKEAKK